MLRAAPPHSAQACPAESGAGLVFSNPSPSETKFATRLHRASQKALPEKILCGAWLKTGQVSRRGGRGREMVVERISVSAVADFEKGRQVCRGCRRAARSAGYVSARAPEADRHGNIADQFRKKCAPDFNVNIIITMKFAPYPANL